MHTKWFSSASLVVLLLVVACGQAPTATASSQKDTLVIGQSVDPSTLDPHQMVTAYMNVYAQICEPLMYWDRDASGNQAPRMNLATSYSWIDDLTLQVKLRDGVKFSNGETFDAEAAKLSIELLFRAYHYSQWLEGMLNKVQVVDPLTINIVLTKPMAYLPAVLLQGGFQVAPKDYQARGKEAFDQAPVCSGPWVFKEHVKDDHITLTANPNYWGGTPKFKTIVFRIIPDDNARVAALEAREIDLAINVPLAAASRIEANKDLKLYSIPSLRLFATHFELKNAKAKPFEDVRVRLALNYAVDRAAMCKTLFAGRCAPLAGQFLSKNHSGYNPNLQPFPYDPKKAKQLLSEAGYPNGFEVDYTYTSGRYPQDKQAGEAIAAYLRAVGLKVKETAVDYAEWARQFDARQGTAMYTVGFLFGQDGYLTLLSYAPDKRYRTSKMPKAFDIAVANAGLATDVAKRIAFMQQAMTAINSEPFAIYLYSIDDLYASQSWLQDFQPRPDQSVRVVTWGVTPK
jgi:peptide/nickel transport system substrate-binding protein